MVNTEYVVEDTPLLIYIKGCGYPPKIDCDVYAESYENITEAGTTFPCHYSRLNPWVVLSSYDKYNIGQAIVVLLVSNTREDTITAILCSILIPNILFIVSVAILVYWSVYCLSTQVLLYCVPSGTVPTVRQGAGRMSCRSIKTRLDHSYL